MFTLIKNAEVHAPEPLGKKSVLLCGETIAWMGDSFAAEGTLPELTVFDAQGLLLVPGFVDGHVHIAGGGGEGGPGTRTPELVLSDMVKGGVTTVVGVLGVDDATRVSANLVAKAQSLVSEGASAWAMAGTYQLPIRSICGGVRDDIQLIDRIVGVGEIALSDHRSSQPTFEEFVKIASAARVGGMLSGKGGLVNIHVGDGPRGIDYLFRAAEETEIPIAQFVPTHMNRNPELFEEGRRYAQKGGFLDLTTSTTPQFLDEGEIKCSVGLKILLGDGIPASQISFTSDAQGSMPLFDDKGIMTGLAIGRVTSMRDEFADCVLKENISMEDALRVVSTTTAEHYKLPKKGRVKEGYDADIVLLNSDLEIRYVFARGRTMMADGKVLIKGTFEE